jgi:uncharacterized protein YaaN involved in tellurite resistance
MSSFELEPPEPDVPAIQAEFALDPKANSRLKAVAREFAGSFVSLDVNDPTFDRSIRQISTIGSDEIRKLSEQARLTLSRGNRRDVAVATINSELARLRLVLNRLMPSEDILKTTKWFGIFARYPPIASYFDRYRSAEAEIETTLLSIAESRDMLLRDNFEISGHRSATRPLLINLAEAIGMCGHLDERFEKLSSQLDQIDPAKAQKLRSIALFEVRQRHTDLLTQMAVSRQSYAILSIIETTNLDLIKGVDRASSTTIAALQTAVVAAQTLTNQNLVLERINGVTTAASAPIDRAGNSTTRGNSQIDLDSSEAAQQVASLRSALADVGTSVDTLEGQQRRALSAL